MLKSQPIWSSPWGVQIWSEKVLLLHKFWLKNQMKGANENICTLLRWRLKISTVIIINTQSRMCQVCLVLLLFLTLDVPGWSSAHRTRLCVKSFGETAVGESFNNHYFWLSVLQSWSFVDKLYCFSQQKHHSYWSSDAHFLSSFVVSSSVCSGLMCFRSSQWWKTRIHHIAFLLTLVNSYWTVFVLQPDCWRDRLHHLTELRHRGGSTDCCHWQPPDANFPQIHLSA